MMKFLFWILWSAELLFISYMLWDEMRLKYLPMPIYIPIGFIWLLLTLFVKFVVKSDTGALVMVSIPGVPLLIMGGFLLIVFIISAVAGPIRWN